MSSSFFQFVASPAEAHWWRVSGPHSGLSTSLSSIVTLVSDALYLIEPYDSSIWQYGLWSALMITVKVIRKSTGKPASGRRVSVHINDGMWGGFVTDAVYTDNDGEAHFDIKSGRGEVYVDRTTMHTGQVSGRVIVYV